MATRSGPSEPRSHSPMMRSAIIGSQLDFGLPGPSSNGSRLGLVGDAIAMVVLELGDWGLGDGEAYFR